MSSVNPYLPPEAAIRDVSLEQGFADAKVFTWSGRLGRLRYLAYTMVAYLAVLICSAIVGGLAGLTNSKYLVNIALIPELLVYFGFLVMFTIRRSHDMDRSGWFALLALIPLVNLLFLFVSGTKGANRFGLQPPPNGRGVVALAFIPFAFVILGIVAAISIPAYQDYVKRARAAQTH